MRIVAEVAALRDAEGGADRPGSASSSARTRSSSSSPTSPRTTCRSRCARSRASPSCSSAATRASSTSGPTATSPSRSTAPSGCRSSSTTCWRSRGSAAPAGRSSASRPASCCAGRPGAARRRARGGGRRVEAGALPTVLADAGQLTAVFQNLIANAVKFRGDEPPRVHFAAERDGRVLALHVRDNGHRDRARVRGADLRHLPAAAHARRVRRDRHRARDVPEDRRAPRRAHLARTAAGGPRRPSTSRSPPNRPRRTRRTSAARALKAIEVLLVEDDPGDVAHDGRRSRTTRCATLHTVSDGVEALDYLRQRGRTRDAPRPDLILLDLNLPRKDGREVLEEIKNDDELQQIPVVVLTTSQGRGGRAAPYRLHANATSPSPSTSTASSRSCARSTSSSSASSSSRSTEARRPAALGIAARLRLVCWRAHDRPATRSTPPKSIASPIRRSTRVASYLANRDEVGAGAAALFGRAGHERDAEVDPGRVRGGGRRAHGQPRAAGGGLRGRQGQGDPARRAGLPRGRRARGVRGEYMRRRSRRTPTTGTDTRCSRRRPAADRQARGRIRAGRAATRSPTAAPARATTRSGSRRRWRRSRPSSR